MGSGDSFINLEIIEKIASTSDILSSFLRLDDEWESGTGLMINFVLCDVVIDNAFAGGTTQWESLEDHKKITIYFKPINELGQCLSSVDSILCPIDSHIALLLSLLKKENSRKQEQIQNNRTIDELNRTYEQQQKEKLILETKINEKIFISKMIPRKPFNKKAIFLNRRLVENLRKELLKITEAVEATKLQLDELLQKKNDVEEEINKSINHLIEELSAKYLFEKAEQS